MQIIIKQRVKTGGRMGGKNSGWVLVRSQCRSLVQRFALSKERKC